MSMCRIILFYETSGILNANTGNQWLSSLDIYSLSDDKIVIKNIFYFLQIIIYH